MNNISTYAADCCAVLLRGGKSRRMGQDKALLPWGDSTFLKTVAGQMDFLDEKYLSVAANDISSADGLSEDWVRLPDLFPDRGPLGGIYTALQTCQAEWALAVSCDVPAVEQRFFKILLKECSDDLDIIYPITPDGRKHMTCAVYRKAAAPILRRQIGMLNTVQQQAYTVGRDALSFREDAGELWQIRDISAEMIKADNGNIPGNFQPHVGQL